MICFVVKRQLVVSGKRQQQNNVELKLLQIIPRHLGKAGSSCSPSLNESCQFTVKISWFLPDYFLALHTFVILLCLLLRVVHILEGMLALTDHQEIHAFKPK